PHGEGLRREVQLPGCDVHQRHPGTHGAELGGERRIADRVLTAMATSMPSLMQQRAAGRRLPAARCCIRTSRCQSLPAPIAVPKITPMITYTMIAAMITTIV